MNLINILTTKIGQTLYSPIFGDVVLYQIVPDHPYPIRVMLKDGKIRTFYEDGKFNPNGEVMLFPSKENRDWTTLFHRNKPAINALLDLLDTGKLISFLKETLKEGDKVKTYNNLVKDSTYGTTKFSGMYICGPIDLVSLNSENDKVYKIFPVKAPYSVEMFDLSYILHNNPRLVYLVEQNLDSLKRENYEVLNLKPFDKVLVRDDDDSKWQIDFFQNYTKNGFECLNACWNQCVPYNVNFQDLLNTINKPNKKYRSL